MQGEWIEHDSRKMPCAWDALVDVRLNNTVERFGVRANTVNWTIPPSYIPPYHWVTAYRLHTPATQPQAPGMRGEQNETLTAAIDALIDILVGNEREDYEKRVNLRSALEQFAGGMRGEDLAAWTQFAAAALQGTLASDPDEALTSKQWAHGAAELADALMAERLKRAGNAG